MKSKAVLTLEAESCMSTDEFIFMVLSVVEMLKEGYNVENATKVSFMYAVDWGSGDIEYEQPRGTRIPEWRYSTWRKREGVPDD